MPQRRALASGRRRGRAGAARPLQPHRLHGRPLRGLRRRSPSGSPSACRSRGPVKAAFFNAGTEAVENAVKFARAYTKRPAVIAFEGGFHGRTLMSLSLTSKTHPYKAGLGPVRARGLPRAVPVRVPRHHRPRTRSRRSSARFSTQVAAESGRRDRLRAGAGRGRLRRRARRVRAGRSGAICDEHGIVLVADEVQTGFGAHRAACSRSSTSASSPTSITVAKSIAMGLPLSGVLGRAEIMDAPGTRRRRRHVRRQPGGAGGRARRARRDRRRGPGRALGRDRRDDPGAHDRRGRSAGRRSATSAASARCSRSSSSRTRRRRRRRPSSPRAVVDAALAARAAAASPAACTATASACSYRSSITDAELDEALGVWEEALEAALD